ncbi:hypothetical protein [Streptomyces sp. NPDC097610]|uniref:hypothetical protein n=1 Tax=Streptomyces sp. NPDC097610 TaxID=3157227 RepID=UPI003317668E
MGLEGDRAIAGHLHEPAHIGTRFARAYVIPSAGPPICQAAPVGGGLRRTRHQYRQRLPSGAGLVGATVRSD